MQKGSLNHELGYKNRPLNRDNPLNQCPLNQDTTVDHRILPKVVRGRHLALIPQLGKVSEDKKRDETEKTPRGRTWLSFPRSGPTSSWEREELLMSFGGSSKGGQVKESKESDIMVTFKLKE